MTPNNTSCRRRAGSDGAGLPSRFDDGRAWAFRLAVRTYNQARRAVTYLRWDESVPTSSCPPALPTDAAAATPSPRPRLTAW